MKADQFIRKNKDPNYVPRRRGPTERKQSSTEFLSRLDVARKFGCNPMKVIDFERDGKLTRIQLGPKMIRYHYSEVERIIAEGTVAK